MRPQGSGKALVTLRHAKVQGSSAGAPEPRDAPKRPASTPTWPTFNDTRLSSHQTALRHPQQTSRAYTHYLRHHDYRPQAHLQSRTLCPPSYGENEILTWFFFPQAVGKEALRGPAYHQRLLPAHTQLKFRKPGQGGDADGDVRDLRAELLAAEAAHHARLTGAPAPSTADDDDDDASEHAHGTKRALLEAGSADDGEDTEAKRRRILEETRDIDADDSESGSDKDDDDDDSDSDDSDSDDEEAELQRELERVKRERQEKREREEREREAAEAEQREKDIAKGNPLLNKPDFTVKRRWDDDVVFKNQARGTEERAKSKEFVNDLLRSDFHKRFMSKYVR